MSITKYSFSSYKNHTDIKINSNYKTLDITIVSDSGGNAHPMSGFDEDYILVDSTNTMYDILYTLIPTIVVQLVDNKEKYSWPVDYTLHRMYKTEYKCHIKYTKLTKVVAIEISIYNRELYKFFNPYSLLELQKYQMDLICGHRVPLYDEYCTLRMGNNTFNCISYSLKPKSTKGNFKTFRVSFKPYRVIYMD